MAASKRYFVFLLVIFFLPSVCCLPEPGKKVLTFKKNQTYDSFSKTMNKGYSVAIKGSCSGLEKINIYWRLEVSQCAEKFSLLKPNDDFLKYLWEDQTYSIHSLNGKKQVYCAPRIQLPDLTDQVKELTLPPPEDNTGSTPKQEAKDNKTPSAKEEGSTPKQEAKDNKTLSAEGKVNNRVCVTKRDGVFLLIVHAFPIQEDKDKDFKLTLNVEMKGKHGYLSASDWPLYPFYGFMSLLYVFYGIVWLIVSACQWRDLLRIQFWIGGVIALGILEKAVFFSEYNNINITGETNPGLTVFAELVSCVKGTLTRILVIIISMGFGIVKPRLGTTLHRVLGVGVLYFILATTEGCFRVLHPKSDPGRRQLIASIPLAVLDASIWLWIFMSLVQTTRTLRIRRNLVKLSLYRHLTNTLIFAVLASVAYMIWSIKTHGFAKDGCITDWSKLWLEEAFWHFLFSIVLLVIMVLWRPTANHQRYAFTPIVDFGDDDMTLSDTSDGMKMGNVKNTPPA